MWLHGVDDPLDYVRLTEQYTLEGRVEQIRCPTLVCSAENDEIGVTAPKLYADPTCEKAFVQFTAKEGAATLRSGSPRALQSAPSTGWTACSPGKNGRVPSVGAGWLELGALPPPDFATGRRPRHDEQLGATRSGSTPVTPPHTRATC